MAVKPGARSETCELFGYEIVLKRGVPDEAWCEVCWKAKFRHREIAE